jgi:protein-ribulosamine 3-kinase
MLNSIPAEVREQTTSTLNASLRSFSFSSGGCINQGGKLSTSSGDYFIKWNDRRKFPRMFEMEAKGLALLRSANAVDIPRVVAIGETEDYQSILLEFVEQKAKKPDYWEVLGAGLATLHKKTSPTFGLNHDNYIGSLPQHNQPSTSWLDFFIEKRLNFQLQLALKTRKVEKKTDSLFQGLFKKLPSLLPAEKPALLHGDLWGGNLITNSTGLPCLIDPAVYYGNREAEIAFTTLFGGFSDRFYEAYNHALPMSSGFEKRYDLYNLYPLLVHVNLFGGGYVSQVVSILRAFA